MLMLNRNTKFTKCSAFVKLIMYNAVNSSYSDSHSAIYILMHSFLMVQGFQMFFLEFPQDAPNCASFSHIDGCCMTMPALQKIGIRNILKLTQS